MNEVSSTCQHLRQSFDRTVCPCGWMHYYCDDCSIVTDKCDLAD